MKPPCLNIRAEQISRYTVSNQSQISHYQREKLHIKRQNQKEPCRAGPETESIDIGK